MPPESAGVTTAFLQSKGGVRQALYLAQHEMQTITTDKWDDEIWGVTEAASSRTKLFFLFGTDDHWVADETRDELIAARAARGEVDEEGEESEEGEEGKPVMEIDESGIPHGFCISEFFLPRGHDIVLTKRTKNTTSPWRVKSWTTCMKLCACFGRGSQGIHEFLRRHSASSSMKYRWI